MASLSEEMKNKRDIKRKAEVLIVDGDLGNFGLYKAILALEYILECAYNVNMAKQLCAGRHFDVIVYDAKMGIDGLTELSNEIKKTSNAKLPELLIMEEEDNKDSIISYLCKGAKGYIPKPFTKESMVNAIYDVLYNRRKRETSQSIVIVDEDFSVLKAMKSTLGSKYSVNIINDIDGAKQYILVKKPDLIILDVTFLKEDNCTCDSILANERMKNRVLFTAESLNEDIIRQCANCNPEGILMKPIPEMDLLQTVEKILLRQSYIDDFGSR